MQKHKTGSLPAREVKPRVAVDTRDARPKAARLPPAPRPTTTTSTAIAAAAGEPRLCRGVYVRAGLARGLEEETRVVQNVVGCGPSDFDFGCPPVRLQPAHVPWVSEDGPTKSTVSRPPASFCRVSNGTCRVAVIGVLPVAPPDAVLLRRHLQDSNGQIVAQQQA